MASISGAATATRSVWSRLSSIPKTYPLAFGVVFSTVKTSFSDLLVQKVVEQREQVDWKRNAAFATFGFVYLGGVQYMIYVPLFGRMFPNAASFAAKPIAEKITDVRGMFALVAQVFLDQCVHHPFMYFPAFYCTRELVISEKPDLIRCLQEYRKNMSEDLSALWKIWVPGTFVNFAFMPMYMRIPFVAGISLVWTCVLSAMRGGDLTHGEEMAGGAVTGATLEMLEESIDRVFTTPVELARDRNHMMITASGRDKPGWVALLSRAVANGGGEVKHSKMTRLGTEFIIQMHIAIQPESQTKLLEDLRANQQLKPLSIQFTPISRRTTGTYEDAVMGVSIRAVGADRPAMLATLSESLTKEGLSIEDITTFLQRRNHLYYGGKKAEESDPDLDFVMEANCVTTRHIDVDELVHNLGSLKKDLNLDVFDIRVQRMKPGQ